jgi:hypothetical protein
MSETVTMQVTNFTYDEVKNLLLREATKLDRAYGEKVYYGVSMQITGEYWGNVDSWKFSVSWSPTPTSKEE